MNTEPLVRTYPEFWLYIALAILVASVIGLVVQWIQSRRATRDFERAIAEWRPRPRDLYVPRAPERDDRNSLVRHARECNLKETTR